MVTPSFVPSLRLGLIGGDIAATRSPALHIVCGLATGYNVTYDLVIPSERGCDFRAALNGCARAAFHGVSVTYPYKELAVALAEPASRAVRAMGSATTITFFPEGAWAHNTDYSGFKAGYAKVLGTRSPGRVLPLGAGGVGRAIAFALPDLGAKEIVLSDTEGSKAEALAVAVQDYCGIHVTIGVPGFHRDLGSFDGVVNCTVVGMVGCVGSPLPVGVSGRPGWGFDVVYTPSNITLRRQVTALEADFLSGFR